MALLNPTFADAGALPGEAARWTISAVASLEVLARLAAHGGGTALLPTHLAAQARPALRIPGGEQPSVVDSVCLVYRPDAQRSPAAKALVAALKRVTPASRR